MYAWDILDRESWMNVLPSTWAFRSKLYPDGTINKLKARLCARGDQQLDVKLLPLPQPHLRARTYAHTYQSTQRATQLRGVLAHAYYVSIQNLNTVSTMTAPYL
jgi:hypothetical protein